MIGNTPGLGPQNLEGNQTSGSLLAFSPETYSTPLLDITQPISKVELIPARPGYIPVAVLNCFWSIENVVGAQTVPAQFQVGSNAAHTNVFTSTAAPTNADVAATNPPSRTSTLFGQFQTQQFANTPIFFDLTTGAQGTGGFKCSAKFIITLLWAAIGG